MNIKDRKKWNNILIFICCAFIISFSILSYQEKEKNLNEIYPAEDISQIIFSNEKYQYTFLRKGEIWSLKQPFAYSVREKRIQNIIAIQDATIFKHIKSKNSDEFGFNNDRYLQLDQLKIFFGDKSLNSEHRYIKIDERILLIDETYYSILASGLAYWLDEHILPANEELLTSISIGKDLYKEAELINLANAWYDAKADNLLYPADAFITPTDDDTAITITFADNDTFQFVLHKNIFLMNTTYNLAYELPKQTAERLLKP